MVLAGVIKASLEMDSRIASVKRATKEDTNTDVIRASFKVESRVASVKG